MTHFITKATPIGYIDIKCEKMFKSAMGESLPAGTFANTHRPKSKSLQHGLSFCVDPRKRLISGILSWSSFTRGGKKYIELSMLFMIKDYLNKEVCTSLVRASLSEPHINVKFVRSVCLSVCLSIRS